jgi:hypothetical protein
MLGSLLAGGVPGGQARAPIVVQVGETHGLERALPTGVAWVSCAPGWKLTPPGTNWQVDREHRLGPAAVSSTTASSLTTVSQLVVFTAVGSAAATRLLGGVPR